MTTAVKAQKGQVIRVPKGIDVLSDTGVLIGEEEYELTVVARMVTGKGVICERKGDFIAPGKKCNYYLEDHLYEIVR